jgi:hypothetical protein
MIHYFLREIFHPAIQYRLVYLNYCRLSLDTNRSAAHLYCKDSGDHTPKPYIFNLTPISELTLIAELNKGSISNS